MLDIKLVRERPQEIEADLKKRGALELIPELHKLIEADKERRALIGKLDELRAKRNALTREIAELKKKGKPIAAKMKAVKSIPEEVENLEIRLANLEDSCKAILLKLPNMLHESVP
ncbi:MAG: serine--tRNA ligase, partial [Candidatus Aenigmatarchaeota archaeon]